MFSVSLNAAVCCMTVADTKLELISICRTHILTGHTAARLSTIDTHSETYLAQGFVTF